MKTDQIKTKLKKLKENRNLDLSLNYIQLKKNEIGLKQDARVF